MTYEEKLQIVVDKLVEARDLTRNGYETQLSFNHHSFFDITLQEVSKILLKLQDDEQILSINNASINVDILTADNNNDPDEHYLGNASNINLSLLDKFDSWYESYLLKQKSNISNMLEINLLKIYDVTKDIEEAIQIANSTTVVIPLLQTQVKFKKLFPFINESNINTYLNHRRQGINHLCNINAVSSKIELQADDLLNTEMIEIKVNLKAFNKFYKEICDEMSKRQIEVEESEIKASESDTHAPPETTPQVSFDKSKGTLKIQDKEVKFQQNSFKANLLDFIINSPEERSKVWSWDEVMDEILGTIDTNDIKSNKSTFYTTCEGIESSIATKTGINDFLRYTKSTVQINNKYC